MTIKELHAGLSALLESGDFNPNTPVQMFDRGVDAWVYLRCEECCDNTFTLEFDRPAGFTEPLLFDELRTANVFRCERSFHPCDDWSETDWATALAGEVGELCNFIKKRRRGEMVHRLELSKELADIIIYADLLAHRVGIDLGEAVRDKFNEVSERVHSDVKL